MGMKMPKMKVLVKKMIPSPSNIDSLVFESHHPLLTGDDYDEATANTAWVTALLAHFTSDAAVYFAQLQIHGTTDCFDFIPELKLWFDPEPSPEVAQNIDTLSKQQPSALPAATQLYGMVTAANEKAMTENASDNALANLLPVP